LEVLLYPKSLPIVVLKVVLAIHCPKPSSLPKVKSLTSTVAEISRDLTIFGVLSPY